MQKTPTSLITVQHPDYSRENLRAMRIALGISQVKLAKMANVTQATISAFEIGNIREVGPKLRTHIANLLVQAEFERIRDLGATPKSETDKLKDRIKFLESEREKSELMDALYEKHVAGIEETNKQLLEMLGWRIKTAVDDSEQREAESNLMSKIGAERIPAVEEETLRAEIQQRGKKGK
jgi:transcriptional regulator with XRE-family HTH domain